MEFREHPLTTICYSVFGNSIRFEQNSHPAWHPRHKCPFIGDSPKEQQVLQEYRFVKCVGEHVTMLALPSAWPDGTVFVARERSLVLFTFSPLLWHMGPLCRMSGVQLV